MERSPLASGEVAESRALTGLRGVAASLVMAHHLYLKVGLDQHIPMLQWGLRKGYLGVDLFFVLSGFVMSMVYGGRFARMRPGSGFAFLAFLVRRVARIWPLHAAVLAVVMLVRWLLGDPLPGLRLILENLALVQAWGHSTEINPPAWSISTEFMAYLLFPLLAMAVLRGRVGPWLGLLAVAAGLALCMHLAPPLGPVRRGRLDIYFNFSPLPGVRCLAGFVMGMLAWRAGQVRWVAGLLGVRWLGPLALVAMLGMMLGRVNDLLIFLVLPVIVLGMHLGQGPGQRALGGWPLHRLGILSYAIYLIHFSLIEVFPFSALPMPFGLPLYVGTTILLAAAAHAVIERPGRRLIRAAGEWVLAALWPRLGEPPGGRPLQERSP